MKRILQKSLSRLHTLLLLAVMFVVGGSAAWADEIVELSPQNAVGSGNKKTTTVGDVSVTGMVYDSNGKKAFDIYNQSGFELTVASARTINKVEIHVWAYGEDGTYWSSFPNKIACKTSGVPSPTVNGRLITWTATTGVNEIQFTTTSDDIYVKSVIVYVEGDGPQSHDYTVTAAAGLNVTIGGNPVETTYNAVTVKESDVVVTGVPAGKKAVVTIDNQNYTITITLVDVPMAQITSCEPAVGTISLDDLNGSFSQIKVNMDTWIGERVYYTSESGNIPAGFSVSDGEGTTYTINRIEGWAPYNSWYDNSPAGYNFFYVYLEEPITAAGTYTLNIPANGVPLYEGKSLPESTFTWTLTAATQFDLGWNFYTALGERMPSGNMKTVTGFTINAPQGTTFTSISDDAALMVMNHTTWEYEKLEGAVFTLNGDNTVTINLPETLTAPDYYSYRLAEGSILAGTLTNKSADLQARVNPFNGQFSITGLTPGYYGEAEGPAPTITFNIPDGKTVKSLGSTIQINDEDVIVSATASGNVVSITLPETNPFVVGSSENKLAIPQYFVVTEDDYTNYFSDAWYITITAPVVRSNTMTYTRLGFETGTVESIKSNLTIYTSVNTEGNHYGYGSPTEVPAGVTFVDGNGVAQSITSCLWWDNDEQLAFILPAAIEAPGHYTLTIPEGVIPCVENQANAEMVFEWTILEPTTYTVTVTGDYTGEDAGVIYKRSTYKNEEDIVVKGEIVESELTPVDVNGYDENVRIENQNIIVTYTTGANISYTVNVVNAPDGATVTLGNDEWTTNGEYTHNTPLILDGNEIVASEPTGYYAVVNYENRVFTVTYYEYNYYSVVVKGISDPAAGVTYHGDNYGAGQQIEAREELTEGSVTASNVTGYEGHVSLVGNTFTVTYSAPSYVEFATTNISNTAGEYRNTKNGVTIVGVADTYTKMLEIYSRQYLTVTSATLPIDRVEFITGDGTLEVNADPAGAGVSGTTWSAGAGNTISSVTFKAPNGGDNYISSIRVYLRVPQLTTYNLAFAGEVPDGAKVTIEELQYGAGEFDTYNENFTTTDIDATWPGYDADVTYDEGSNTFTVTYYATTTYDVVVDPATLEGAAVIYNEVEYAAGTDVITCRGTIDENLLSAKSVYGYVGAVTVSENTITVTYTESEYFDVAESQVSLTEGDMVGTTKFKVVPPAGKSFSEILVPNTYGEILTINGETNKWTQLAIGYEGSFITFTNPNGPNDYGTFVVEFPAECFKTADGKKNNAFTYTYTVEDPAAFTEPYYVNIYGYEFGKAAPAGASVNLVGFDTTISESGNQYTAHPNVANFGNASTDLEGYYVTTDVNTTYKNVSVYFHKLALADSFSPANEENSLDDDAYQYGYSTLTVTFDAPFADYYYYGSDEIPAGITATLPDGVTLGSVIAYDYDLRLNLNGASVPGTYSIQVAKDLFSFSYAEAVNGTITNAAVSKSWTLTPRTTFSFNSRDVEPSTGSVVSSINALTIAAPAGVEFAAENKNVTIKVNGEDTQVSATISTDQIVLAYNATTPNTYDITIPAGIFTATDGRTNKELTGISYTIQPTLSINPNSVDEEGNTWTTFCLNKDFTLEDGYTPYIVRDNGNGGIKLVEVKGTEIADEYNVYFNTADDDHEYLATMSNGNVISSVIDGKYEVTYNITNGSTLDVRNGVYVDVWNYNKSITFTVRALSDEYSNFTVETRSFMPEQSTSGGSPIVTAEGVEITASNTTVGGIRIKCFTGNYNTPVIPANTGILVKGAAKSGIQYTQAGGTKADVSGNLLWGCTQSQTKEVGNDQYIYKLAWASSAYDDLGFYWGSANGHSVNANAGKAYLILDADQSAGSNRMLIFGGHEETPTAIDSVVETSDDAPIFNLQGKRVSRENLPAGVYVQNGRKFIVK